MESQRDRLVRYLDNAWAVEKALVSALRDMARDIQDPEIQQMLEGHAQITHQQEEALEARIRALGAEPSGSKGWLNQIAVKAEDMLHMTQDQHDRTTQHLIKAYATENFEMAMYSSLESYANAINDQETAQLARTIFEQEKETANNLWPLIAPVAARAANAT